MLGWKRQRVAPRRVPETVEQECVAPAIAVSNHVEQEREKQLRTERAASAEVTIAVAKLLVSCD